MSKFLKNIKSLFVEVEDAAGKPNDKTTPPDKTASTPKTAQVAEVQGGERGKVNSKFTEVLYQALERANMDGFDYIEYRKSLQSLQNMQMDEATRYKSTFAMAQTMGVTPDKLLQSAGYYIGVLRDEEKKFEQALINQQDQQVKQRKAQLDQTKQQIEETQQQIKQLQSKIKELETHAAQLDQQVGEANQKIITTQNDFIASYNAIVVQIEADIQKMQQHLK